MNTTPNRVRTRNGETLAVMHGVHAGVVLCVLLCVPAGQSFSDETSTKQMDEPSFLTPRATLSTYCRAAEAKDWRTWLECQTTYRKGVMIQRFLFAYELKGDIGLKAVLSEYSLADTKVLDELLEKSVRWENSIPRSDPELLFAQFQQRTDDVSSFIESLCRCVEKGNELPGQSLGTLKNLDVNADVAVAEFASKKSPDPASAVRHPGVAKEPRGDRIMVPGSQSLEIRTLVHLRRIDGAWYVADAEEVRKERKRGIRDSGSTPDNGRIGHEPNS